MSVKSVSSSGRPNRSGKLSAAWCERNLYGHIDRRALAICIRTLYERPLEPNDIWHSWLRVPYTNLRRPQNRCLDVFSNTPRCFSKVSQRIAALVTPISGSPAASNDARIALAGCNSTGKQAQQTRASAVREYFDR